MGKCGGIPLEILLQYFFAKENRSLACSECNTPNDMASAESALTVVPGVLVLHLKRFRYDPRTCSFCKMMTPVKFGPRVSLPHSAVDPDCEGPDKSGSKKLFKSPKELVEQWEEISRDVDLSLMSPSSSSSLVSRRQHNYSLVAIVRHFGSTASAGHYVCDIKNDKAGNGTWTRCDDSSMYPIKDEEVFGDKVTPYILFFTLDTTT